MPELPYLGYTPATSIPTLPSYGDLGTALDPKYVGTAPFLYRENGIADLSSWDTERQVKRNMAIMGLGHRPVSFGPGTTTLSRHDLLKPDSSFADDYRDWAKAPTAPQAPDLQSVEPKSLEELLTSSGSTTAPYLGYNPYDPPIRPRSRFAVHGPDWNRHKDLASAPTAPQAPGGAFAQPSQPTPIPIDRPLPPATTASPRGEMTITPADFAALMQSPNFAHSQPVSGPSIPELLGVGSSPAMGGIKRSVGADVLSMLTPSNPATAGNPATEAAAGGSPQVPIDRPLPPTGRAGNGQLPPLPDTDIGRNIAFFESGQRVAPGSRVRDAMQQDWDSKWGGSQGGFQTLPYVPSQDKGGFQTLPYIPSKDAGQMQMLGNGGNPEGRLETFPTDLPGGGPPPPTLRELLLGANEATATANSHLMPGDKNLGIELRNNAGSSPSEGALGTQDAFRRRELSQNPAYQDYIGAARAQKDAMMGGVDQQQMDRLPLLKVHNGSENYKSQEMLDKRNAMRDRLAARDKERWQNVQSRAAGRSLSREERLHPGSFAMMQNKSLFDLLSGGAESGDAGSASQRAQLFTAMGRPDIARSIMEAERINSGERQNQATVDAQRYGADKHAEAGKYSADKSAEAGRYGADKQAEASRYGADKDAESNRQRNQAELIANDKDPAVLDINHGDPQAVKEYQQTQHAMRAEQLVKSQPDPQAALDKMRAEGIPEEMALEAIWKRAPKFRPDGPASGFLGYLRRQHWPAIESGPAGQLLSD